MKYWIYQENQVKGPFDRAQIGKLKGFEADSLVCPEGRKGTDMGDWQRASSVPELTLLIQSSENVATATLPDDPVLREAIDDLKRKINDFESRLERMQRELDERPESPAAAAAAPEPSAAGPDPETLSKLEEIDDKLVGLSSLDAEVRKLRERIEELERRPAAEPAPAPAERQAAKPVDPLAEALAPAKASAPAPVPDMPVVEPAAAKAPSFQPMDFKVETFEKVELTAPAPQPVPMLAPSPSMELTQPPSLTPPPVSEPPSLTPPPAASPFGAPAPAPLPALTPLPIQLGGAPEPGQSPFTTPPPPFPSAFPSAGPTPLAEFVHSQPPTPFPSMVGDRYPEAKPPEISRSVTGPVEMVTGASPSGRSGKKAVIFLAVIVFLIGLGLIGSLYLDTKRIAKGGASAGPTGVEKTGTTPGLSGLKTPKNLPVSDPMPEIAPADFSQSAVDLVKSFTAPGGRASLGEQLDREFPSKGGLSPWMVEPLLGQSKYQVTFYVGTRPVYVFLVQPKTKAVEGVNDAAKALINGVEPKARPATPPAKKPRRVVKKKPVKAKSDTMIVAPGNDKKGAETNLDDLLKE